MGREPFIPGALTRGPFTLDEARRHGLNEWQLKGVNWRRICRGTYLWAGLADDPIHQLEATRRRLPPAAAFSGLTAAWLHGLDVPPCGPIEATVPASAGVSARAGVALRRSALIADDVVRVRGLPATRVERTLAEVCRRMTLTEGVVLLDAALHRKRVRLKSLHAWTAEHCGFHGVPSLRRAVEFAEAATESPMESRLRMLLVLGGLPRPQAQVSVYDRWGRFIGRPDLYYDDARLGIEYDGGTHRDSLAEDNRRQNKLLNSGVRLLRFTAADLRGDPASIIGQVREMLREPRGLPAKPALPPR